MFDIGFWELCLIAVVALLILGPERLPVAARTAGLWVGRARRMIGNVKSEIDRELQLDEIRSKLKEEENNIRETSGMTDFETLTENTIADVKNVQDSVQNADAKNTDTQIDSIQNNSQNKEDLTTNLILEESEETDNDPDISDPDINTGHASPDSESIKH